MFKCTTMAVGYISRQKMLTLLLLLVFILSHTVNSVRADDMPDDVTVTMAPPRAQYHEVTTPGVEHKNHTIFSAHQKLLMAAFAEPEFQAALQIMTYCSPLLVAFGLIGNTLSLLVTLQKKNSRISCCTYMTALAVCDNGSLLTLLYYWFVTVIWPVQWSRRDCVVWVYAVFLMTAGSGFLLVGVTFDRFMAVCFPFQARRWCTPRRARIIVMGILALVAIFYIPMAAMSNVVDGNVCAAFRFDEWPRLNGSLAIINLLALPVIPFGFILIMNIKILSAVNHSGALKGKERASLQRTSTASVMVETGSQPRHHQSKRDHQLTVMLLIVSFTYLLIILPISCRVVAYIFIKPYASPRIYAVFVLLFVSLNHILFLNNAINFYLYYITGSRFRRDLKNLLSRVFTSGLCSWKDGDTLTSLSSSSTAKRPKLSSGDSSTEDNGVKARSDI